MSTHNIVFFYGAKCKIISTNVRKFLDRQVWANSADPDQTATEQSDQGLHCLQFPLYRLDVLL